MEQIVSLVVIAVFGLIFWAINENTQAALNDPENKQAIYLDQLAAVSELAGRGLWLVTIIRQSGNVHSTKDLYGDAGDALASAISTFRRAKIDGVGIIKNGPDELHFGRLFRSHRGSNEGKKVGQAVIRLLQAETPAPRAARVSHLTLTRTCDCGEPQSVGLDELEDEIVCGACGKTQRLDAEKAETIRRKVQASIDEAKARVEAGEDEVQFNATISAIEG